MNVDEGTQNSQTQEQSGTATTTTTDTTQTDQTQTTTDKSVDPPVVDPKSLIGEAKSETVVEEFVPLTAEDITLPEGLEVSEADRDAALAIVNNRELSPKEQLQGLIDLQGKLAKDASEAISKTWEDTQQTWKDEVKADPQIGGDKLPTTLAAVNRLVTEYGSNELFEVFAATGAGNNVHVIKFLHNVAGKLLEGGPVSASVPTNQTEDRAARMFPSMKG